MSKQTACGSAGKRAATASTPARPLGRWSGASGMSARSSASRVARHPLGRRVPSPAVHEPVADARRRGQRVLAQQREHRGGRLAMIGPLSGQPPRRRAGRLEPGEGLRPADSFHLSLAHALLIVPDRELERRGARVQAEDDGCRASGLAPEPVAHLGHVLEVLADVGAVPVEHGVAVRGRAAARSRRARRRRAAAPRGRGGSGSSRSAPPCRTASWSCPAR